MSKTTDQDAVEEFKSLDMHLTKTDSVWATVQALAKKKDGKFEEHNF